jgi:imidazolonepropionase-like amidohydrolase
VPGYSLHRELELLVNSGMSNSECLHAVTGGNAVALGVSQAVGTIQRRRCADMVLLERDPLNAMANIGSIRWVMKAGVGFAPDDLWTSSPVS